MATLSSSSLPDSARRNPAHVAELRVHAALAEFLPPDTALFHSVSWLSKPEAEGRAYDGEADFVIVDPARGVMVLEVKGGEEIRREQVDGEWRWYSRDVHGEWHAVKDPFRQAVRSKHALLGKLK